MARTYTINGVTQTITDWCREYGMDRMTVANRLHKGMPIMEALTTPMDERFTRKIHRSLESMRRICARCEWSEIVDHHPACCYIDRPDHGRRPVSAEVCTAKGEGSVFKPRSSRRWTPAQQEMFHERGMR